jgi:hypothetical protein
MQEKSLPRAITQRVEAAKITQFQRLKAGAAQAAGPITRTDADPDGGL